MRFSYPNSGLPVRLVAPVMALFVLAAACSADEDDPGAGAFIDEGATLVVANSPGTVSVNGPQRIMVALVGEGPNAYFGAPNEPADLTFTAPDGDTAETVRAQYLATDGVALGLYVAEVSFGAVGRWTVAIEGTESGAGRTQIDVAAESVVPEAGDPAPPSQTPTAATPEEVAAISTDPEPDPAFYQLSIAEAVANGRPTVVAFATPAFCQTALCGPTIETVKEVVGDNDDIDVVHVEPFDIAQARTGSLAPVAAMFEWQLVSEPWVFVINEDGVVTASFEGTIGAEELDTAVSALG
ncbi:MAG: hypothetical protein AAFN30_20835 [Actinomycetota bacterium]